MLYNGTNNGIHVESTWKKGSEFWFYVTSIKRQIFDEISPKLRQPINSVKILNFEDLSHILTNLILKERKFSECLSNKKGTISIVDDDQMNLLVAKEYKKYFGLDYIFAYNGKEALELIQKLVIQDH